LSATRIATASVAAASLAIATYGCGRDRTAMPSGFDDAAWREELDAWVERRDASLRQPDGWLSLAGLFWLEEGQSTLGADASSDVVFPAGKAPARVGVVTVAGDSVRLRVPPDAEVTHAGAPVTEIELATDAGGEPTLLELGPLVFHAIERGGRIAIRLKDRESPLLADFAGMERFAPDPAWRITARLERYDPPRQILVPNVIGPPLPESCPGRLRFEVAGAIYALEPTGEPGGELFVVFGDATNGGETYGGGRFLYADWPGENDVVVLDFNRAYNPPCVFTPWATCPLPPPQNRLPFPIRAGETTYRGGVH